MFKKGLNMFKKGLNMLKGAVLGLVGAVAVAAPAMAEGSWTPTFTVDTAPVFTVAGIVVTAIGAIWCIRKVIKLGNHS